LLEGNEELLDDEEELDGEELVDVEEPLHVHVHDDEELLDDSQRHIKLELWLEDVELLGDK